MSFIRTTFVVLSLLRVKRSTIRKWDIHPIILVKVRFYNPIYPILWVKWKFNTASARIFRNKFRNRWPESVFHISHWSYLLCLTRLPRNSLQSCNSQSKSILNGSREHLKFLFDRKQFDKNDKQTQFPHHFDLHSPFNRMQQDQWCSWNTRGKTCKIIDWRR